MAAVTVSTVAPFYAKDRASGVLGFLLFAKPFRNSRWPDRWPERGQVSSISISLLWLSDASFVVSGQLQQALPDERVSLLSKRPHGPRPLSAKIVVHGVPLKSQRDSVS
ncbi:hypothetical protein V5279_27775 [Bradyrhizobium sp. 26S5]|uniref:hypothetical protein n=1 Tax=Bradyrhizobium sp. 26S5 TaxID=3139729 RepID=UPI0030D32650